TAELPGWAAPQQLFWTGALPKNDHGKVDRRALAATLLTAQATAAAEGTATAGAVATADPDLTTRPPGGGAGVPRSDPRAPACPVLLAACRRLFRPRLADPALAPAADFFASGGQSILAMRLVTDLRADFPGTVGLRATTVFDHPTPRRLAEWLSSAPTRP